jgi:tetratricopeptide (TPR) repeat protein
VNNKHAIGSSVCRPLSPTQVYAQPDVWDNLAMSRHRSRRSPQRTLDVQLRAIRLEFPKIRPYQEENDLQWWNDGLAALQANQLTRAEQVFKQLVLAQPEHFDGYYGLAQVYQRQHRLDQAILFADEALRLGQVFLNDGSLDPSTLEEMKRFRLQLDTLSGPAA